MNSIEKEQELALSKPDFYLRELIKRTYKMENFYSYYGEYDEVEKKSVEYLGQCRLILDKISKDVLRDRDLLIFDWAGLGDSINIRLVVEHFLKMGRKIVWITNPIGASLYKDDQRVQVLPGLTIPFRDVRQPWVVYGLYLEVSRILREVFPWIRDILNMSFMIGVCFPKWVESLGSYADLVFMAAGIKRDYSIKHSLIHHGKLADLAISKSISGNYVVIEHGSITFGRLPVEKYEILVHNLLKMGIQSVYVGGNCDPKISCAIDGRGLSQYDTLTLIKNSMGLIGRDSGNQLLTAFLPEIPVFEVGVPAVGSMKACRYRENVFFVYSDDFYERIPKILVNLKKYEPLGRTIVPPPKKRALLLRVLCGIVDQSYISHMISAASGIRQLNPYEEVWCLVDERLYWLADACPYIDCVFTDPVEMKKALFQRAKMGIHARFIRVQPPEGQKLGIPNLYRILRRGGADVGQGLACAEYYLPEDWSVAVRSRLREVAEGRRVILLDVVPPKGGAKRVWDTVWYRVAQELEGEGHHVILVAPCFPGESVSQREPAPPRVADARASLDLAGFLTLLSEADVLVTTRARLALLGGGTSAGILCLSETPWGPDALPMRTTTLRGRAVEWIWGDKTSDEAVDGVLEAVRTLLRFDPKTLKELFVNLETALREGSEAAVLEQIDRLAELHEAQAALWRAKFHWQRGDEKRALADFRKALAREPFCLEALEGLWVVAMEEGALGQARSALGRLRRLAPSHVFVGPGQRLQTLMADSARGRWDEMLLWEDLDPADWPVQGMHFPFPRFLPEVLLGLAYLMTDAPEKARMRFEAARELHPRCADAWFGLGELALREGKVAEARNAYERALSLEPRHAWARQRLKALDEGLV